MKSILVVFAFLFLLSLPCSAQKEGVTIRYSEYLVHFWPSFVKVRGTISTMNAENYRITYTDQSAGEDLYVSSDLSREEAISAALLFIRDENTLQKFQLAKHIPNFLPYEHGIVIIGYWKETNTWDIFNYNRISFSADKSFRVFTIVRK